MEFSSEPPRDSLFSAAVLSCNEDRFAGFTFQTEAALNRQLAILGECSAEVESLACRSAQVESLAIAESLACQKEVLQPAMERSRSFFKTERSFFGGGGGCGGDHARGGDRGGGFMSRLFGARAKPPTAAAPTLRPGSASPTPTAAPALNYALDAEARSDRKKPVRKKRETRAAGPAPAGGVADIVASQHAAGAWSLADAAEALGASVESCAGARPACASDNEAWATALVLGLLSRRFAELKGEWELSARKARRWLVRAGVDVAQIETAAAATLLALASLAAPETAAGADPRELEVVVS